MSLRRLSLIAIAITAIAAPAFAAPPLTAQGWGKLRIGMRERDAVRLFHLRVPKSLGADSVDCRQDEMPSQEGLSVMAQRGIVTRISIEAPNSLVTDRGLGIGATEDEVKAAYGSSLKIQTAPYLAEPAHELVFWTTAGKRGVRYDTNAAGAVEAIHVGDRSITLIEGCS
ncbi:MAG TPA: hypothetical protein VFE18_13710 [Phenylobacterium sp.]|jgi:hypothetical protein|uniref:hypothetical protein n=1 Tax=Phenylobacterium sp. TaxID=1871053 RepID=UPI002D5DAE6D|nr:hypothetical protein [Phenylobacterium sp.]HZZ69224.1 hypothetical protein [Phenylobacterium sp.]